ncbi:MAG TPA: sigma-70 family RNA polymerase sigma factor [Chthoniobacterales bacterium]
MTSRQLELLYDAHAQSVFAFLLHLSRSQEVTRDLLQDVFLRLAGRMLPPLLKPRAYLLRLAHNVWIDHVRREIGRARVEEEAALESHDALLADAADPEQGAMISSALAKLPSEQRAVVHLKIWEDLSFREIGAALDIPTHTAASRYRYALTKLRGHIRPSLENEHA